MPQPTTCPRCGRSWLPPSPAEAVCPGCGLRMAAPPAAPPVEAAALEPAGDPAASAASLIGKRTRTDFHDLIDMTAMVDVVFFLLIFFLVTSLHGMQASIEMPAPDPQQTTAKASPTVAQFEQDGDFVVVRIDQDDTVWIEDSAVPSQQDLVIRLRDMREGSGGDTRGILVLGHEDASYDAVVTVLDAGAEAGMQDIRIAQDNSEGQ